MEVVVDPYARTIHEAVSASLLYSLQCSFSNALEMTSTKISLFLKTLEGKLSLLLLLFVISISILGPVIDKRDPLQQDIINRLEPPSVQHPCGTDYLGRDILVRLLYGGRVSLLTGFLAAGIAGLLGGLLGITAGFVGGGIATICMRISDFQLSLPFLALALVIQTVTGRTYIGLILILGVWGWAAIARPACAKATEIREQDYVEAALAAGASAPRILFVYILPNVLAPLLVIWTVLVGQIILAESALSFLGLGMPAGTPSWGSMISEGRNYIFTAWWLIAFPGLLISMTILGTNLFGDALRDALDPKTIRKRA